MVPRVPESTRASPVRKISVPVSVTSFSDSTPDSSATVMFFFMLSVRIDSSVFMSETNFSVISFRQASEYPSEFDR